MSPQQSALISNLQMIEPEIAIIAVGMRYVVFARILDGAATSVSDHLIRTLPYTHRPSPFLPTFMSKSA